MTDRDLVIQAIRKAGNQKALSEVFGVAQSAISEWGRTRPIPRHVRARLEEYVRPAAGDVAGSAAGPRSGGRLLSAAVRELIGLLEPDPATSALAHLPRAYRKRYEQRLADVIGRVRRELEEYQALLEAEHRTRRSQRKGISKRPES